MKYTAKVRQVSTSHGEYLQTVEITANSEEELEFLLEKYADEGEVDSRIKVDDSEMPRHFNCAGGFASRLESFTDEKGRDLSHIAQGVFE